MLSFKHTVIELNIKKEPRLFSSINMHPVFNCLNYKHIPKKGKIKGHGYWAPHMISLSSNAC